MADQPPYPGLNQEKPKAPPPKKSGGFGGLFGGHPQQAPDLSGSVNDINKQIIEISRRLRMAEERFSNMSRRVQLVEENGISLKNKVSIEVKTTNSELSDMKSEIDEIKRTVQVIIKELRMTAKREDVEVLKKYLNLWEPVNFVTQNEVEKIVRRVVQELESGSEE